MNIVYNYIELLTQVSRILIPLSFTIFIFAYREQKEIAYSILKKKVRFPFWGFIFSLCILLGLLIIYVPQSPEKNIEKLPAYLIIAISIIWISFTIWSYKILLRKINVLKEFDYNINLIKKRFNDIDSLLLVINNKKLNKYLFSKTIQKKLEDLIISVEICFQILITKDKYKLNNDFTYSLDSVFNHIINPLIKINRDEEKFSSITPYSGYKYYELYILTIKNLNLLLEVLINNRKDLETNLVIDSISQIRPFAYNESEELRREWKIYRNINSPSNEFYDLTELFKEFFNQYFIIVYQSITILSQDKDNRVTNILDKLIDQEYDNKRYFSENDFLTLNMALFIRAVESNNIKILTDITNTYLKYLKRSSKDEAVVLKLNSSKIKPNTFKTKTRKKHNEIETKILRSIFLGVVKSIELGHYSCAGFLIKILVKNFDSKKLFILVEELFSKINNTEPELYLSEKLTKRLNISLSFSPASYEYCFLKTILLIWIQQNFAHNSGIVTVKQKLDIAVFFVNNTNYFNYLLEKIEGLNANYGLISLKEENISNLKNKFKL